MPISGFFLLGYECHIASNPTDPFSIWSRIVPRIWNSLEQIAKNCLLHRSSSSSLLIKRGVSVDIRCGVEIGVPQQFLRQLHISCFCIDKAARRVAKAVK